jgi:hypothetical protein
VHHEYLLKLPLTVLRESFQYDIHFAQFLTLILQSSTWYDLISLLMIFLRLRFVCKLGLVYWQLIQILFQFPFFTLTQVVNAVLILEEIVQGNVGRPAGRTLQMNVLHLRIILLVLIMKILIVLHLVVNFDIIMVCKLRLLWLLKLKRLRNWPQILIDRANWRRQAYLTAIGYLCREARIIILGCQAILMIFWRCHALLLLIDFILLISRKIHILFLAVSLRD